MTNPYTPLDPPGDTTNRTPKMLLGIKGKSVTGGPLPPNNNPGAQGSPQIWSHKFFGTYGQVARFLEHGEDEEDVECEAVIVDNTKGIYTNMQSHIITPGAGTAELVCKYSPTLTLGDMGDFCKIPLSVADAVVPRTTIPILTPEDSRVKKLLLKLTRRGGNGVITPEMWNAIVGATSGTPPTVPTGTDDPLPEGGVWGDIVFDLNANSTAMKEMYADGADVNFWPDETGNGFDMSTVETFLLPKYRRTGTASGMPCVEWAGSNVPLLHALTQPTAGLGSYTYYFVMDAMDGGDVAAIWGGGFGDSFQYVLTLTSDTYQAANNNLFGAPSLFVNAEAFMGQPHVLRWTKWSGAASHGMFHNGTLKGSAGAAPQSNNQGYAQLMHHAGGLGLSGKISRIVAYNTHHLNATNSGGGYGSGATPIDAALINTWGVAA